MPPSALRGPAARCRAGSSVTPGRPRLLVLLIIGGAAGVAASAIANFVAHPQVTPGHGRTWRRSVASTAARHRDAGDADRGDRSEGQGGRGGGTTGRKSVLGILSFGLLGLFGWSSGAAPAKAEQVENFSLKQAAELQEEMEQIQLRDFLLQERPVEPPTQATSSMIDAAASTSRQEATSATASVEDGLFRRTFNDWWDALVIAQAERQRREEALAERRQQRRKRNLDRRRRKEEQERAKAEQLAMATAQANISEQKVNGRTVGAESTSSGSDHSGSSEDEDSSQAGIFTFFAAVKSSVLAALLGTPDAAPQEPDEAKRDTPTEDSQSAVVLDATDPETPVTSAQSDDASDVDHPDWLESWTSGLSRLFLSKPEEPTQPTESPDDAAELEAQTGALEAPTQGQESDAEEPNAGSEVDNEIQGEPLKETEATLLQLGQSSKDNDADKDGTVGSSVEENHSTEMDVVVEVPPPEAPGMAEANLIVRVEIDPKQAIPVETRQAGVARLMAQPGGQILATMAQDGWEVEPKDPENGIYELTLPPVRYELPGGVVSIPPPRFQTTIRDTYRKSDGEFEERLQGDLVLQNGDKILTVELGFPFRTSFSISAAGWTRACIGSQGDAVVVSNYVEIGLNLPKIPGLPNLMQYFVKNYGTESTEQCADALARGADIISPEWWESARDAIQGLPMLGTVPQDEDAMESPPPPPPPPPPPEPISETEHAEVEPEVGPPQPDPTEELAEVVDDVGELPTPEVPGMAEANLIVRVEIDPLKAQALETGREGVARLMAQSKGRIIATMAQESWEVRCINTESHLYELVLPAVRYEIPGGVVSIVAPRFLTTLRDSCVKDGEYQERLHGDLVLQNGESILSVEMGFPFKTTFSISAAGWTRARVGSQDDNVVVSNYVEVGLQLPKVPGLNSIMQYFVKSYGTESTESCALTLAKGADEISPEWWESARDAIAELPQIKELQSWGVSKADEEQEDQLEVPSAGGALEVLDAGQPLESETEEPSHSVSSTDPGESEEIVEDVPPPQVPGMAEANPHSVSSTDVGESAEIVEDVPPPEVPGMAEANLIVRVKIEPKTAAAIETQQEGVARLMSQSGGQILATMAQDGWEVTPVDEEEGLFEVSLPPVRYELPGGTVSIPPPRFLTTIRDTHVTSDGGYVERLQGDLVLQNGDKILTVELGFPFRTSFSVSASGWTRAKIGSQGDSVSVSNYVEIGLNLPKFPGLVPLMQYFVKSYGNESTEQCVDALARGADRISPEWWESARDAMQGLPMPGTPPVESSSPEEVVEVEEATPQPEPVVEVEIVTDVDIENEPEEDPPLPEVPGMAEANLIVKVEIDPTQAQATETGETGIIRLMALSGGQILATMAQDGWEVKCVDSEKGLYELMLPAVRYELPGGVVSIPPPRFLTTVRDSRKQHEGGYQERLQGDLVLQNGERILTVELGFPFRTSFSISASGWSRASVGREGDNVVVANSVEIGLQIPKVPGLSSIMQYFVRNYGAQSTKECADCLARGADQLEPEWWEPGVDAVQRSWGAMIGDKPEMHHPKEEQAEPDSSDGSS